MTNARTMRGYTLLEMIVAVGIFSLVMLAATGAYFTLIDLDRRARGVNDIVSNLSFAVDSMARAVRTGTGYSCPGGPNSSDGSCSQLTFTDSESPTRTIVYYVSNNQVYESINGTAAPITDPAITIQALTFYVRGVGIESSGAKIQPQVNFVMRGTISTGHGTTVDFDVEGGGTERLLELPAT